MNPGSPEQRNPGYYSQPNPAVYSQSNQNYYPQSEQGHYPQPPQNQGFHPQSGSNQANFPQVAPHQVYYSQPSPSQGYYPQPPPRQAYDTRPLPNQAQQPQSAPYQEYYIRPSPNQIWQPRCGLSWQYVLQDKIKLDHTIEQHEVWIIDLFDNDASLVDELHKRGRKVIAYFSAGSYENWRPDASRFKSADLGRKLDDWEGEKWLQTNSSNVRDIMRSRLDLAHQKGFDGVDPDNIDGYDNKNGLKLKKQDAIDYVLFLSHEAHARGLAVGLKNAGDIVPQVVSQVEYCVQEQCVQFDDVEQFVPFIEMGKPVFHVEYPKGDDPDSSKMNNTKDVTPKQRDKAFKARARGFSTIIKNVKLDQWIQVS